MQIRVFPENRLHVTATRAPQIKSQPAQVSGSVFGAQCKVTISKEGRRLSEQSNKQTARSAESIKAEKTMMRQQEQSEQLDKQSDELKDKYAELLKKINKTVKSVNNSYMSKPDEKTIQEKEQLFREIGDQKQKQLEANQNQANYAQEMAMQSSKAQDEIDENNRDLFIMLKSIEESEKAEEEQENGGKVEEDSNGAKAENSASDAIWDSATRFTVSSIKREMDVVGSIQALNEQGHDYISRANEIAGNAFDETKDIKNLLDDENYTNDEKKDAVFRYGAKLVWTYNSPISDEPNPDVIKDLEILVSDNYTDAEKEEALSRYRARMSEDGDLGKYRQRGVQMIKDSKEGKLKHIENNPLLGMEETKDSMIQSAVDAVFNQEMQGKLDETSKELEDAVKELIDERNDIDRVDADKKEEDEEDDKKIGELFQTEESEQTQE